jgi:hypothetical protein
MAPHVRVDSYTLRWYIAAPVAFAIGMNVLAYLTVTIGQYPPEEARSLLGHALVGVALSVPYGSLGLWWLRCHRTEHIRWWRTSRGGWTAGGVALKLGWTCVVFLAGRAIATGAVRIVHDLPPTLLDVPLLLANMLWGLPIAAGETGRARREALGGT